MLTRPVGYHGDGGLLLERLARNGLIRTTADHASAQRPLDAVLLESADITTRPRAPPSPSWRHPPG